MTPLRKYAVAPPEFRPVYTAARCSAGLLVGDTFYVSGQLGMHPDGSIPSDAAEQYVLAFENTSKVLAEAGLGFGDVVELVTFHTSLDDLVAFMAVKDRFIDTPPFPAWTGVGVAQLNGEGALVEIKCIAIRS